MDDLKSHVQTQMKELKSQMHGMKDEIKQNKVIHKL